MTLVETSEMMLPASIKYNGIRRSVEKSSSFNKLQHRKQLSPSGDF